MHMRLLNDKSNGVSAHIAQSASILRDVFFIKCDSGIKYPQMIR